VDWLPISKKCENAYNLQEGLAGDTINLSQNSERTSPKLQIPIVVTANLEFVNQKAKT